MRQIFFILFFLFGSCGKTLSQVEEKAQASYSLALESDQKINNLIDLAYENCISKDDHSCKKDLKFFLKERDFHNGKKKILILDSESKPAFESMFFKNEGRVLNIYTQEEKSFSGKIKEFRPVLRAPLALDSIFEKIREEERRGRDYDDLNINRKKLHKLHGKIKKLIPKDPEIPHGEHIFDMLAKYNPEAQFILAPYPIVSNENKVICEAFRNPNKYKEFIEESAREYLKVIHQYGINYVNLSWGPTYKKEEWRNRALCSSEFSEKEVRKILRLKAYFLDLLSEGAPDTLFFVAMPNDYGSSYLEKESSRVYAAKKRPNFVRVAYWSKEVNDFSNHSDQTLNAYLHENQRDLWDYVDFYVNGGFNEDLRWFDYDFLKDKTSEDYRKTRPERDILEIYYDGVFPHHYYLMSTSYATPLALSYANYLMTKHNFSVVNQNLARKIIDPILTQQLLNYERKKK